MDNIYSIQSTSQLSDLTAAIGDSDILSALSSHECYIELSYRDSSDADTFTSYKVRFDDFTAAIVRRITQYVTTEQLNNKIAELDSKYVHIDNDETIFGEKTFAKPIQLANAGSSLSATLTYSGISCASISCASLTCTPNVAELTARHALWS